MLRKIHINKRWKYIIGVLLIWITVHVAYISIEGLHDFEGKADVAVILGNRVFADGTLSDWLKGRTDAALQLYQQKRIKKIYASGGISENDDGDYPEGTAMKQYLVKRGVPTADVIVDAQFYHITRTKYIFKKLGIENVHHVASHAYGWADIVGTLREVPAFYK